MNILFAANFDTGTGYAWKTIEMVYRRVGERLAAAGHRAFISYPSFHGGLPVWTRDSPLEVLQMDFAEAAGPAALWRTLRALRRHRISVLYLTDLSTISWRYPLFRWAGVKAIVVHDRTSGSRTERPPWVLGLKRAAHRRGPFAADRFIGVSRFVAGRLLGVNGTPPDRTFTVYNGIDFAPYRLADRAALHRLLGLPPGAAIVFAAGRIQPYKGFHVLLDAAAILAREGIEGLAIVLCGEGAALPELRRQAERLGLQCVHFLGKRDDVPALLSSATLSVVPSLWSEAFGLSVVEAMAAGVPVVASAMGGIPELVEDGVSGAIVPPGEAEALAAAMGALLRDAALRSRMAEEGRRRATRRFSIDGTVEALHEVLNGVLEEPGPYETRRVPAPSAITRSPPARRRRRGSSWGG